MKVCVTGGSGRIGRHVIADLIAHGHTVVNADRAPPPKVEWLYDQSGAEYFTLSDMTVFGDVVAVFQGVDAVIHLAAIPNATGHVPSNVFKTNMISDFNVLEAAELVGIRKIAKASSINALGMAFSKHFVSPRYFPVDEKHETHCQEIYSTTKWLGEELSAAYARKRDVQIASLRFTWVADDPIRKNIEKDRDGHADLEHRAKAFWAWVDVRDVATSCRLAVEVDWNGHEVFWINASDTYLDIPTIQVIERWFPNVPVTKPIEGYAAAISIEASKRIMGWQPRYAWHDVNGGAAQS